MDKPEFVQGLSQDCSSYCAMCKVLGTVHWTCVVFLVTKKIKRISQVHISKEYVGIAIC